MGPKFLDLEKMHYEEWLELHYKDNEMEGSNDNNSKGGLPHKR